VLALAPSSTLASLDGAERFALDLLLDLSRVLRFDGDDRVDVVRLDVGAPPKATEGLSDLRARAWTEGIHAGDAGGTVTLDRALLQLVHAIASATAEQRSPSADRYGRVPPSVNALVHAGVERDPVVSEIARQLADAIRRAAGRRPALFVAPWPGARRWAAALTHDLDAVEWWPAFTALRVAELARKGKVGQVAGVIAAVLRSGGRDVVWSGVREVLDAERVHGVRATWFVLCGTPTFASARAGDLTYRPEGPLARRILSAVRAAGHEIGLHGSFATAEDGALFRQQRARLADLSERDVGGVRQHFLRMRPMQTLHGMAAAGFRYDTTFGFPDRNGFRLGVADVIPLWDEATGATLPLDEVPFVWMDRALSKYAGVEQPEAWIDDALALADRCRAVEGLWVGIWHPNLTPALGFPGAPAAYARLVAALVDGNAWIAPLGEIVRWRRARRTVRASAMPASDGVRLTLADPPPTDTEIAIEDARGRRVESRAGR
jgi:hypothetical protein